MKLPFDFGLRFVLRLLLPGVVFAVVLFPLAELACAEFRYPVKPEVLFVGLGLIAGIALLLLEHPIFMLLAGRRYWPGPLRRVCVACEAQRLIRLTERADTEKDTARQTELDVRASEFPRDASTGEPQALFPTRLGNLLASYETYPTIKHGLDGVFFWPRLWVTIDKDLREEIDSAQAVADGGIYACFALALAAPIAVADAFVTCNARPWLAAAAVSLILSAAFYRASLPKYAQFGELFAATFDQHRSLLKFGTLVEDLDEHMADRRLRPRSEREATRVAWRFLKWHRYRPSGASENVVVRRWMM